MYKVPAQTGFSPECLTMTQQKFYKFRSVGFVLLLLSHKVIGLLVFTV